MQSSDEGENGSASSAPSKAAKGQALPTKSSWSFRRPKNTSAEPEEGMAAEAPAAEQSGRSLTDGSTRCGLHATK